MGVDGVFFRMGDQIGYEMTDSEIVSFLQSKGHGVLSLAHENRGYGLPLSYAYDEATDRIVFEFITSGKSKREHFLETTEEVTLTVHTYESSEKWESVILTGSLHPIDPEAVADRAAATFFAHADDVANELRRSADENVDHDWYELRIDERSGRHGGTLPHQHEPGLVRFSGYNRTS